MPAPKAETATLAEILAAARRRLAAADIDDPALEARMIVEHFTGIGRSDAISAPGRAVEADVVARSKTRWPGGSPASLSTGFSAIAISMGSG